VFGNLDKYIIVFLVGLIVTLLLTPVVRTLALRFGVVDLPDARRPHKRATARGGGVAVVIGVHAACLVAILFPWPVLAGALDFAWWEKFALASLVLLVVGLVDDIRGMKPLVKLGGQVVAASLMWGSGTRFGLLMGHTLPVPMDCALTVVWLVAVINAFNLIDGMDGLASGLAAISAVGLAGILVMQHDPGEVLLLVGFIGACVGFLRYNFHPASIFLGDSGSMFLGFTLGVISLQTFNKDTFLISLTIPIMVLGVPIYDALLAVWRRSVRSWLSDGQGKAKRGIMQPDLEHLHHRLSKSGLSTQRVALFLYVVNGCLVIVGLTILSFQSRAKGIFLIALLACMYVLLRQLAVIELRETGRALLMGLRRPTHTTFKALLYPVWDMVWLSGSLAFVMWLLDTPASGFWRTWFLDLPIWVTPTFSMLALSSTYLTYWPGARLRDVLTLMLWLQAGITLSLSLALIIEPSEWSRWCIRALLVAALGHPGILAARMFGRSTEEIVIWLRDQVDDAGKVERVLLYGAGVRAQMFLKDRAVRNVTIPDRRQIVGLIDDEPSLHYQWVYGQRVLGGRHELPHIIERRNIGRIIIVADLPPDVLMEIGRVAAGKNIKLSRWQPEENEIAAI